MIKNYLIPCIRLSLTSKYSAAFLLKKLEQFKLFLKSCEEKRSPRARKIIKLLKKVIFVIIVLLILKSKICLADDKPVTKATLYKKYINKMLQTRRARLVRGGGKFIVHPEYVSKYINTLIPLQPLVYAAARKPGSNLAYISAIGLGIGVFAYIYLDNN